MSALVHTARAARALPRERVALEGTVLGLDRALGPLATSAVALRWVLEEPWEHCLGSGWLGDDLVLAADDGRRVHLPLAGARLVAPRSRWSPPCDLAPSPPPWIEALVRGQWRFCAPDRARWLEAAIRAGERVRIEASFAPRLEGYRSAPSERDVDLEATAAAGPIAIVLG